ncbi:hypothetical protein K8I61_00170, partial [bacterium]|nr:hypothetical protein [bacterium]
MKNDDRRDALALLSAASNSAYLKFLARDAGLTEKRASFVVTALARELDPEFASALAADDENSAASRLASRDAGALAALRSPAARS